MTWQYSQALLNLWATHSHILPTFNPGLHAVQLRNKSRPNQTKPKVQTFRLAGCAHRVAQMTAEILPVIVVS